MLKILKVTLWNSHSVIYRPGFFVVCTFLGNEGFFNDPLPLFFFQQTWGLSRLNLSIMSWGFLLKWWKYCNNNNNTLVFIYFLYNFCLQLKLFKCYSRLRWSCPNNFLPRDIYLYACWVTKHIIWYKFIWSQTGILCFVSEWSNNILGRSWLSFGDFLVESKFLVYKFLQILWQCALFGSALEICYNENCFH